MLSGVLVPVKDCDTHFFPIISVMTRCPALSSNKWQASRSETGINGLDIEMEGLGRESNNQIERRIDTGFNAVRLVHPILGELKFQLVKTVLALGKRGGGRTGTCKERSTRLSSDANAGTAIKR